MLRTVPKTAKYLTVVLAAVLVFAMLSSVLFIVLEAHHDCEGESCAICARILACEQFLQKLLLAVSAVAAIHLAASFSIAVLSGLSRRFCGLTLIALKVKLSD